MSATTYDSPPATVPPPVPSPNSSSGNGGGSSTIRNLIIALAVVAMIAIVLPIVLVLGLRTSEEQSVSITTDEGAEVEVLSTDNPDAAAPQPGVAVAAAPTAVPAPASGAAPAAPAAAPVVTQLAGESPSVFKVTGIASGSSLNVRQSAGTTNPLLGTLDSNATGIAGTGRRVSVNGSEWREIKFNNGTGWVFAGYLALAPAPVAAATPAPAATPVAVTALADDSPAIYSVTGVSTGASLNVRAEPGTSQRLLGTLSGDTSAVPSTGRRSMVGNVEWREIGFRDSTGWVNASFLTIVPEAPKTVLLPSVPSTTIGIVPLTSSSDRLVLRADPGYDQNTVSTVGAEAVNVTATGRIAQIGSEVWIEISTSGSTGWVPRQLTIPVVRSAQDVIATNGVAAVTIDKVTVAENGDVTLTIGTQTVKVTPATTVTTSTGSQSSIVDWAHVAKTETNTFRAEVTVVGNQITRMWVVG